MLAMSALPKITILTIVRNGAAYIERCLQSVITQGYENLEYIVLDGASTDGTQAIIEKYREHITIYYSRPDKGPYDAAQQGMAMATGDILGQVMADDWLNPDALHTIAELYRTKPEARIFCFTMQEHQLQPDGTTQKTKQYSEPNREILSLEDGLYCQGMTRFYATQYLQALLPFRREYYPILADRDLYIRIGLDNSPRAWTPKVLYNFMVHKGSQTTGGSASKVITLLDETIGMARDYLRHPDMSADDRALLRNWYCFNSIRAVCFRLKAGRYGQAIKQASVLLLSQPIYTLRNLVQWKMPEAYRAKRTSD